MDINDPQGLDQRYARQKRLLEEALEKGLITETEKNATDRFIDHEDAQGEVKDSTLGDHMQRLRLSAQRADTTLTKMDEDVYDSLIVTLKREHGVSEGTINQYKKSLKKFFRYHGRDWSSNIKMVQIDRTVDIDEVVFDDEEIQAMLDEANHRRETTVIALLADTGLRIGAILSIPLKNVDLSGNVGIIKINTDAHVKGASGRIPLTFSRGYVARYIDDHPQKDNQDAALIHKKPGYFDPGEDGAVHYDSIRPKIKDIGEAAGLDRSRIKLHNFRHTCITRWILEGLSYKQIVHRATWVDGTDMLGIYDHARDEELNRDIAVKYGIADPEDFEDHHNPETAMRACTVCQTDLPRTAKYCHACGNPMTATEVQSTSPTDIQDPEVTADQASQFNAVLENMSPATVLTQLVKENPQLLEGVDLD